MISRAEDLGSRRQVVGALATALVVGDAIFPIGGVEGGDGPGDLLGGEQILEQGVALCVELFEVRFHYAQLFDIVPIDSDGRRGYLLLPGWL